MRTATEETTTFLLLLIVQIRAFRSLRSFSGLMFVLIQFSSVLHTSHYLPQNCHTHLAAHRWEKSMLGGKNTLMRRFFFCFSLNSPPNSPPLPLAGSDTRLKRRKKISALPKKKKNLSLFPFSFLLLPRTLLLILPTSSASARSH